jgi:hypothetical protein
VIGTGSIPERKLPVLVLGVQTVVVLDDEEARAVSRNKIVVNL